VAVDDGDAAAIERAVSGARLLAGEAALTNAKGSLQVHGGMGFSWEVDVHLYLKRAWVLNTAFGTPAVHADAVAATLV
jgi:alkylation response protein AidB-like acyl-CoA dehydrogenase